MGFTQLYGIGFIRGYFYHLRQYVDNSQSHAGRGVLFGRAGNVRLPAQNRGRFFYNVNTGSTASSPAVQNVTYYVEAYAVDTSNNWSDPVRSPFDPYIGGGEDSWTVADSLPAGVTAALYDIEYRSRYDTVAASSPGSGWVNVGFSHSDYVAVGSSYMSEKELTESETRRLVSYYYYHYCGPSHGVYADHTIRNNYIHYDSILNVNDVYPVSRQEDDTDPGYWAYVLAWTANGNYAKCKSGVTCDGSYGEHDERAYYWYRMSFYQDYVLQNYYHWSRTGNWVSAPDSAAASVQVRYRRKQIPVTGIAFAPDIVETTLSAGSVTLNCQVTPQNAYPGTLSWSSNNALIAEVSDGTVTLLQPGIVNITCESGYAGSDCLLIIHSDHQLVFPAETKVIGQDAFRGNTDITEIVLPEGLERIENGAFAGCTGLRLIRGGNANISIVEDAFQGCEYCSVLCERDSTFASYSMRTGYILHWFDIRE